MTRAKLLNALLVTTALVAVPAALTRAQTLPSGGQVASGQVNIATPAPGQMTIQQSSQTAIVNWQSFSIGQGGRVDIRQPNADAAMLNRVTGTTPSSIAGQLNANGRVYLVNPNGIAIGPTGEVRAQGFVASTLDIGDEDFRAGRRNFQGNGASAAVSNAGLVEVGRGGYAALLGGQVSNTGTVSAPAGRIGLGAAERASIRPATLDLSGDGFLQVTLPSATAGSEPLVSNSGTLTAPGGRVELAAATARDAARRAVNMSGVIEANAVASQGGAIVLSGGPGGAVEITGQLDASSAAAQGGSVTVTGQTVALQGARIAASGATGGGRVRVGGDREGRGPLERAEGVRADATTTIQADATRRGNGGDVVVWSDTRTDFAGRISARGGAEGGDGGQAEVSSRGVLNYTGTTDLRAPAGAWGTLLLDPYNITISDGATSGVTEDTSTDPTSFTATAENSVINAADLVAALGLANVIVSTGTGGPQDGDITATAPLSWDGPSTLTLQAARAINLNAAITASDGGLTLDAGGTIGATGAITVGRFELLSGNWVQNTATLPGLSASDFRLTGGTFLRATDGDGTTTTPWLLTDIYGVQGMATRLSGHYRLANDIAAAGTAGWNAGDGFRPIGTSGDPFTGSLDGAGRVISGLTINRPSEFEVGLFGVVGLFGPIVADSTIRNIGLVGGSVTGDVAVGGLISINNGRVEQAYNTGYVEAISQVGGLIGINNGTVEQAYTTGTVKGLSGITGGLVGENNGTITQSHATGNVDGAAEVGGLVGANAGTVSQSYATGTVLGTKHSGGLVGINYTTITEAYAIGDVTSIGPDTGGLVGNNEFGTITKAYATGAVTSVLSGGVPVDNTGGLVGRNNQGTITQAYATGKVVGGSDNTGGLAGSNSGTITQAYASGRVTGTADSTGGLVGTNRAPNSSLAMIDGTISLSFWDTQTTGRGTVGVALGPSSGATGLMTAAARTQGGYASWDFAADWFQDRDMRPIGRWEAAPLVGGVRTIRNLNQLQLMAINPGDSHRLGTDIAAAPTAGAADSPGIWGAGGFVPVGNSTAPFTGQLDGAGRVITGLTIYRPTQDYVGLFGLAGSGSTISNIGLQGGSVTGRDYVGALVGHNLGTIEQAYATGTVSGEILVGGLVGGNVGTITQAHATGAVTGATHAGGLAGFNFGSGAITQAYATGAVTGVTNVGGLVGRNAGTVTQAYATGAASGQVNVGGLVGTSPGTIEQAYATGAVTGTVTNVGGLVGTSSGTIRQTYAAGAVTGTGDFLGGLVGDNSTGTINSSLWDREATLRPDGVGAGAATGATGRTTAEMQDINSFRTTYGGWNFLTVWSPPNRVGQNNNAGTAFYPQLYSLSLVAAAFVPDASREYGQANPPFGAPSYSVLRTGDTTGTPATIAFAGPAPDPRSNVGAYEISASGMTVNSPQGRIYRIVHAPGTLMITPRPITVTADPQSRVVGAANPVLTYQIGGLGLINGDALSGALATTVTLASNVGSYPITRGDLGNPNYSIAFTGNTLTITPRPASPDGNPGVNSALTSAENELARLNRNRQGCSIAIDVVDESCVGSSLCLGAASEVCMVSLSPKWRPN